MSDVKQAHPDHPVHELITKRWSPYQFSRRTVAKRDLQSLFEAARWAASSYNEQPWSYLIASREDEAAFATMISCLVEGNQAWAQHAAVVGIGCANQLLTYNGTPNPAAFHDLGLASANLTLEATARGLYVHQMIGILPDRVREAYAVPDEVQPLTGLAIGHLADEDFLADPYRQRDLTERTRKPLDAFVFTGQWGTASELVTG